MLVFGYPDQKAIHMRKHLFFLGFAVALPVPALAEGCFGPGTALFHCSVQENAKRLDICLQGEVAFYSFGPVSEPAEIVLARQVERVHMRPWNGVGSSIYEELAFYNGDFEYTVHYAIDRIAADNPTVTGAIAVTRGDEQIAQFDCDAGSVSEADFYPLYEAKEAAGQCWDPETFTWGTC